MSSIKSLLVQTIRLGLFLTVVIEMVLYQVSWDASASWIAQVTEARHLPISVGVDKKDDRFLFSFLLFRSKALVNLS